MGIFKNFSFIFLVLCLINVLNYMDRGIIPGSTNEFDAFIKRCLNTKTPDAYLGLIQVSFIIGLSISSILYGHLVHFYRPFTLIGIGFCIWTVAVFLSGLSYYTNSFALLLLGRMISGVGEASFQCIVPPWIVVKTSEKTRATWLGFFYTAVPVGVALGYSFSANVSALLGWQYSFFFEVFLILPFLFFFFHITKYFPIEINSEDLDESFAPDSDVVDIVLNSDVGHMKQENFVIPSNSLDYRASVPRMYSELKQLFTQPVYLCLVAGYAAQSASLIGLSTFGSSFAMDLGFFQTETAASTAFGIVVGLAGLIGTPLGGLSLDRMCKSLPMKRSGNSKYHILKIATGQIVILNSIGLMLLLVVPLISNKWIFMIVLCIGSSFMFASIPGISMSVMQTVPPQSRSLAIAMVTICIHIFGDVPSPIIVGYIKDSLAPDCIGGHSTDSHDSDCNLDSVGLRLTVFLVSIWLGWTVLFFSIAWRISVRNSKKSACLNVLDSEADADEDTKHWLGGGLGQMQESLINS